MPKTPKPFHLPLSLVLLCIGGMMLITSKFGSGIGLEGVSFLLFWLSGFIAWLWGCFHFVVAKDLPLSVGFLGLFFIVGFIIILVIAKKQPEIARAAARRQAANPKKEYRGDPTSLY